MELVESTGVTVNTHIALFQLVNPSYERLFNNKTQRAAMERLITKFGADKMHRTITALPEYIYLPYAPSITTPYELETKLGKLIVFVRREQAKQERNIPVVI